MDREELQQLLDHGYDPLLTDAPKWILSAWVHYKQLPVMARIKIPFLYFLLGGKGTPSGKAPKKLAFYREETPFPGYACGNCPYAYEKVIERGQFVCSQVRQPIEPKAWCIIPNLRSEETGWPELGQNQIQTIVAET